MLGIFLKFAEWFMGFFSTDKHSVAINGRKVKIVKQIGEGGYSFVYLVKIDLPATRQLDSTDPELGEHTGASGYYALKKLRIEIEEQKLMFEHEVAMHRKIGKHPNVIQLIDSALVQQQGTHGFGYLIFPFYKQGTLQDLLFVKEAIGERIPLAEIVKYTNGICQGLMAFHSQSPPLAFRDMKPANILIDLGGNAILMDLGSVNVARVTVKERLDALKLQESCAQHCTAPFRAPELFDISSNSTFDERTDVWSLGCTLYALAYYQSPFDGSATSAMSGKIPFPSQTPFPQEFHSTLQRLLVIEMHKRPFVPEILKMIATLPK